MYMTFSNMSKLLKTISIRVFALSIVLISSTLAAEAQSGESTPVPCPVEVATDIVNGTVTVDKAEALAGETVTITVTPAYGYAATSSDVSIETTIDPAHSHAPRRAPALDEIFHPVGDVRATHDFPTTYTFTMPEYPLSVLISATFTQLPVHNVYWVPGMTGHELRMSTSNGGYWGDGIPEGTLVTVTIKMTDPENFIVERVLVAENENRDNEVEITNLGNGVYTFIMPAFEIIVRGVEKAYLRGVRFDANNHWATYYGDHCLNIPDGVQGYVVTGVTDNEVQLELLSDDDNPPFIPWKMGVLLYSETPMDEIITVESSRASWNYTSILKGSTEDMEMTSGYVLYGDKFIRARAGTLPAHRCYLPIDSVGSSSASSAPRVLKIRRPGEGTITGIESIDASNEAEVVSTKYVNMLGIVSDKPFRGVNVMIVTRADGTTEKRKVIK